MSIEQIIFLSLCLLIIVIVSVLFVFIGIKNQKEVSKYLKYVHFLENEYKSEKSNQDMDEIEAFYKELYAEGSIKERDFKLALEDIEKERSKRCKK